MSVLDYFGGDAAEPVLPVAQVERRVVYRRLNRILAFTGLTIDDVVNDPIAKNKVRGFWRLSKEIDRRSEVVELERQWNPTGRMG